MKLNYLREIKFVQLGIIRKEFRIGEQHGKLI